MPVNVDRIPLNNVPKKWAYDTEIGPWIRSLLATLYQLRQRSGGDDDFITQVFGDVVEGETPFNYDIRDLQRDRDKFRAEDQTERKVRSLTLENQKLKAELQTQRRKLSLLEYRVNQLIAEVATNA